MGHHWDNRRRRQARTTIAQKALDSSAPGHAVTKRRAGRFNRDVSNDREAQPS